MALGFGAERQIDGHFTPSYWADFSIEGDKILVVGCGDGGLIDAIRASSENFVQESWGSAFPYGVGVAGHAFRFRCPVAWFRGSRERSSVIRTPPRSGHTTHDWILCFPLFAAFPGEAMGVVSIAGNDAAPWYRLRDLARSSAREDVLKINLQMMYDLNAALWELLEATWDSDAVREARARLEHSWPRKP